MKPETTTETSRHRVTAVALIALMATSMMAITPTATADEDLFEDVASTVQDLYGAHDAGDLLGSTGIYFEPNLGQFHEDVLFKAHGTSPATFLTKAGAVFDLVEPETNTTETGNESADDVLDHHAVSMDFQATNPALATGESILAGVSNHFKGNDPTNWVRGVPHFESVRYTNFYDGIDLVWYSTGSGLKYDFIVHAGADPTQMHFTFSGANGLFHEDGQLVIQTSLGDIVKDPPYSYQPTDAGRVEVSNQYVLQDGLVTFDVTGYDASLPLVIDPLVFSTYHGDSGSDIAYGVAVDASNNAYLTGATASTTFPATTGAYQTSHGGSWDIFVSKFNAVGSALEYATYIGGSSSDKAFDIEVDSSGNAYVAGTSSSSDYPTTVGAFQTVLAGADDAVVTKLDATGSSLSYSTYLGGEYDETGNGIALDGSGDAYVAGVVLSDDGTGTTFPTTSGAFQETAPCCGYSITDGMQVDPVNAFLTKLNAAGSGLVYSTFLGGGVSFDRANDIALDASGNAYVTGQTVNLPWVEAGTEFPTTSGAYHTSRSSGAHAFVTKMNSAGSNLVYSTFLGGDNDDDSGHGIHVDSFGNAFVVGTTEATDFPTTLGAFQTSAQGGIDAFAAKLNALGAGLDYATYLGGSSTDQARDVAMDGEGNTIIAGFTLSSDFPTTSQAAQSSHGGNYDAFAARLNGAGSTLRYATLLGGANADQANAVAVDSDGKAYMAGRGQAGFPTTSGALQTTHAGNHDAFLTKLNPTELIAPPDFQASCPSQGVALSWSSVSGAASYNVYYGSSNPPSSVESVTGTSWQHEPAWTASSFYYQVTSVNGLEESPKTAVASKAPCDLVKPGVTGNPPVVDWTNTIPNIDSVTWNDGYSALDDGASYRVVADATTVVDWTALSSTDQPTPGDSSWSPSWSPSALGQGTNEVDMRVWDRYGTLEQTDGAYVIRYDTQAPDAIANAGSLLDDFNDGSVDTTKWSVSGGVENGDCGSQSSPNALKFSASGTRSATTKSLNVGGGGSVAFYLKIGTGSSPCENADAGEDVALEYSTDGGSSWTGIATYDSEAFGSFTLVSEAIPAAAQTSATQFRWRQVSHSGSGFDAWAIDDVNIDTTGSASGTIVVDWVKTSPTLSRMCFLDPHSGLESNAEYWVGSSAGASDVVGVTAMQSQPSSGQSTSWCPSFQSADLDEGTNYVTIHVEDVLGHADEVDAYEVRFDSVPDAVTGLLAKTESGGSLIAEDTWQTDATPRFEWSASSTSPIAGYSYALTTSGSNPDNTVDTTNEFFDASTLSDGTWFFKVKAKDEAGNWGNVEDFKLKVDATDPVFTSLASSTHEDPDEFYSRESATVSWSASDASSGVKEYHYQVVDGACPSSLSSPTTTTATSATEPVPGAFKKYRFCIEAEDEAGNVGGIQSLNLFVDTAKPVYTDVDPEDGQEIVNEPLYPIQISYNDEDGGLDPAPSDTIVDADLVEFFVDGVDMRAAWEDICAPNGPLVACTLDVNEGGITYEPLLPWEEGRHEMFVSIADTAKAGGNTETLRSSFFLQCTGSTDADCDRINDQVEHELCSRAVFSEILIPETEELGHACRNNDDYRAPMMTVIVPTEVQEGPDADGDGAPQYVRIKQTAITVDLESAGLIGTSSAPDVVVDVDDGATGDDSDPNVPVQSVVTSPFPVPTGYELGEDSDGDGVPKSVDVEMSTVVFDRRNPTNPVSFEEENPSTFFLDDPQGVGDDQDPQSPAASVVEVPVKVPYDIELGPDQDNDGVPEYVEVKYRTYTFDRREALDPLSFEEAPSEFHTLDEDDDDADVPVGSSVTVSVPTNAWHNGDGDDDYVPGSATVEFTDVTVDRTDPGLVSTSTRTETHELDEDDGDRDNVVPFSLVDADDDGVPDELEFPICLIEDQSTPDDGTCTSDLQDYTPPDGQLYPNPWDMV